ncbi:hypothetical protein M1394_03155 [Candidatus Marsarchaeota archaeon]|nr:hypothetical protein [Candidatus Marsarchaeota archaeon]
MEDVEILKRYNDIYLGIILRYRSYIEEKESLYVAELPTLVTPDHESIVGFANAIKARYQAYSYYSHCLRRWVGSFAYEHVKEKIINVTMPVQFWLNPSQTLNYGAGDVFDKIVLLCTLLLALGNASSKAMAIIRGNERRFLVYFEFDGRIVSMDLDNGIEKFDSRESLLDRFGVREDGEVSAYEFNDKMYVDIV